MPSGKANDMYMIDRPEIKLAWQLSMYIPHVIFNLDLSRYFGDETDKYGSAVVCIFYVRC
jgi:hypothetical protein